MKISFPHPHQKGVLDSSTVLNLLFQYTAVKTHQIQSTTPPLQVVAQELFFFTGIPKGRKGKFPAGYVQKYSAPSHTGSAATHSKSSTVSWCNDY